MADSSSDLTPRSTLPAEPAAPKRVHPYGRLTTAIAILALATAVYALWRLDSTREHLDQVNDLARSLDSDRHTLQAELQALTERERVSAREFTTRLAALDALPRQVQELNSALEDVHARTEGPQRAWSRAEALFLMEIAQRSLVLNRDVATAITALESADSRLASVRDPALTAVRKQLATDLQQLRATRIPDRTGLLTRLFAAEAQASRLPVKGLVAINAAPADRAELPDGFFARARAIARNALAGLIRVRPIGDRTGVVTEDEQLVRRQHLQLLLFTARTAVARHDQPTYRSTLSSARQWVGQFFDAGNSGTEKLLVEIQRLEAVEIDPVLPDIAKSSQALQRLMPTREAVER